MTSARSNTRRACRRRSPTSRRRRGARATARAIASATRPAWCDAAAAAGDPRVRRPLAHHERFRSANVRGHGWRRPQAAIVRIAHPRSIPRMGRSPKSLSQPARLRSGAKLGTICVRLQLEGCKRDLVMFNLAIDGKLGVVTSWGCGSTTYFSHAHGPREVGRCRFWTFVQSLPGPSIGSRGLPLRHNLH
jgi:hypothetical protein